MSVSCRLALCDDSAALVRLLQLVFQVEQGIEVVGTATDGIEVVDLCARERPDVLLLDVAMPRRDGIAALPHVLEASPGTKVLMYTGFASDSVRRQALDGGALDVVLKGGSPLELADVVRRTHRA